MRGDDTLLCDAMRVLDPPSGRFRHFADFQRAASSPIDETDPLAGADQRGNPIGSLMYSNAFGGSPNGETQITEWCASSL